jgi:HAD superfamily hydrolase (TIGR01549 family)
MLTTLLFDFSRVILNTKDETYPGSLNELHKKLSNTPKYNFFDHYTLNAELLDYLKTIKDKYPLYIYTTGTIQNVPEVRQQIDPIFKEIYTVHEIGLNKDDKNAYLHIAQDLNTDPTEILFIDDQFQNINAAKAAGLQTIHYLNNGQLFSALKSLLRSSSPYQGED